MTTVVLPIESQANGLQIYANPGLLPATAITGTTVAVASDTSVRQWNGTQWLIVGDDTVVTTVNDTNSVSLTLLSNVLSANAKVSTNAADAANQKVDINIEGTGVAGLRAQIPNTRIQSTITASAPIGFTSGNISIPQATSLANGFLSSTDWSTFNSKPSASRLINTTAPLTGGGDLSADRTIAIPAATTSVDGYISAASFTSFTNKPPNTRAINTTAPITGGGDLSADRTIAMPAATGAVDGYLSSATFNTFNNKVGTTRAINTTAPLSGGGDLSADRTLSIPLATNAVDGYLSAADRTAFNAKVDATRAINTTAPITGGGNLSADRTIAMAAATGAVDGYLTAANFTTFNGKQAAITIAAPGAGTANCLTLTAGSLNAGLATLTLPGIVSTAAQAFGGAKTFISGLAITNNATNNTYVSGVAAGLAGASSANLTTSTVTLTADSHNLVFEIGTERVHIACYSNFTSALIQFTSDPSNLALLSDAGVGLFISKAASSNVISVKNRLGGTRVIRIRVINTPVTSATAWV